MMAAVVFNGHAAAMSPTTGLVAMIHVTAAAWWVASLSMLYRACVDADSDDLVRLVLRFSSLAVFVVAGLIAIYGAWKARRTQPDVGEGA